MTIQSKPFYAGAPVALPSAAGNPIAGISAEWIAANFDQLTTKQARLEVTVGGSFQTGDTVVAMLVDADVYNASTNPVAILTASRVCSPNLITGVGLADSSSNGLHASKIGSPTLSANNGSILGSAFGQSIAFAGVDGASADGFTVAHNALFDSSAITLECRGVKRGRTGVAEVFAGVWGFYPNLQYALYFDGSGHIGAQVQATTTTAVLSGTTAYDTSAAHDFAVGFSGGTARLYADGVIVDTQTYVGTLGANPAPLYIGRDGNTSGDSFQGSIDEVHLSKTNRYGSSGYTPATAPFTADANTIALYHMDSLVTPGSPSTNATFELRTALLALPSSAQNVGLVVYNQNGARGNVLSAQIVGMG